MYKNHQFFCTLSIQQLQPFEKLVKMTGNFFLRRNFETNNLWSPRHRTRRSFHSS